MSQDRKRGNIESVLSEKMGRRQFLKRTGKAVALTAGISMFGSLPLHVLEASASKHGDRKSAGKPELAFPVISDIHIQQWHPVSHDKFKAALSDLHQINPDADALIINGDLTEGSPNDYAALTRLLAETDHPKKVYCTIGNHEYYLAWYDPDGHEWNPSGFPNGETEEASISRFLKFVREKKVYYEQQIKGYTFLFLGSEQYRQSDPDNLEDAYVSPEQLNWLQGKLKHAAKSRKPIFVFLHQPLPYTVAGTSFCCVNNRAVVQHEELKRILSPYPQVFFFSGHTHWELKLPSTMVRDRFTMVGSSSVVQPWTDDGQGGEKLAAPEESEGLYVEVFETKVVIRGRDFYRKRWIPEARFEVELDRRK